MAARKTTAQKTTRTKSVKKPAPVRGGWTDARLKKIPDFKRQICRLTQEGMFLGEIAQQLGIARTTIVDWLRQDKDFREAHQEAKEHITDTLEQEAIRRARDGILEPLVFQGRVVLGTDGEPIYSRKYSDPLLMFLLKGQRRDVYGDQQRVEQTTKLDVVGIKEQLKRKILGF